MTRQISSLIPSQLPEFVRSDHPRFVSFLEAYYEYLDNTNEDIRYITDIDESLNNFENSFFNSFIPFLPRDIAINKEFVFKNILPMFLAKGSEQAFKYFFRILFDKEAEILYPGNNILRASGGKWVVESILRLTDRIYSTYISDGERLSYYLPDIYTDDEIEIFVDSIKITSGYSLFPEYQKIVFDAPPVEGSIIEIDYLNFIISKLNSRKVTGQTSGATAIIESGGRRISSTVAFFELLINTKTLTGTFSIGETILTDIFSNNQLIPLRLVTSTTIASINITNGGQGYNVGDPVIITGNATNPATALIDNVTSGTIDGLNITNPGAGFKISSNISANGYTSDFFHAYVSAVDDSGLLSCNTIIYNTDVIQYYENTSIDSIDYNLQSFITNVDSTLSNALTTLITDHLGGITQTNVDVTFISSAQSPQIYTEEYILYANTSIKDLGVIGNILVINPGENYEVGDWIVFDNSYDFAGFGANAYVSDVDANGGILFIRFEDGGLGYRQEALPILSVTSANGTNAELVVENLMGYGEGLLPVTSNVPYGVIQSILVVDGGLGYTQAPLIDLRYFGDGNATAEAVVTDSLYPLSGKWKTSDSIISSSSTVLEGLDYFIDFSYVIKIEAEFASFKDILKQTIHPAGMIAHSQYLLKSNLNIVDTITVSSTIETSNIA